MTARERRLDGVRWALRDEDATPLVTVTGPLGSAEWAWLLARLPPRELPGAARRLPPEQLAGTVAFSCGLTLVTPNGRESRRVAGLQVADWMDAELA